MADELEKWIRENSVSGPVDMENPLPFRNFSFTYHSPQSFFDKPITSKTAEQVRAEMAEAIKKHEFIPPLEDPRKGQESCHKK